MEKQGTIIMSRQQLYDEIWKISVSGVAKKYNLHYGKLIATCKREGIPFPSSGYWTKLKLGKNVSDEIVMLPESEERDIELSLNGIKIERIKQAKNFKEKECAQKEGVVDKLLFLPVEERRKVIDKALSLEISAGGRLHPVLIQYKQAVETYNKQLGEEKSRNYYNPHFHNPKQKPDFISEVSEEGLKRIIAILDVIYKAVEALGGHVDADLSMKIKSDYVRVRFVESKDKIKHELTKQEARELLEYNDAVKHHRYASKPQIRQYDHIYNGKLRIVFGEHKYIRDNAAENLEDRLGDILILLYEKAEENRIDRERREEAQRKREEEARRQEEIRKRKELEIQKTKELVNKAEDYRIACNIRAYIAAVGNNGSETNAEWLAWAKGKADWYDPTIALEDEFLGKREHGKSKEEKELGKQGHNPNRGWNW